MWSIAVHNGKYLNTLDVDPKFISIHMKLDDGTFPEHARNSLELR